MENQKIAPKDDGDYEDSQEKAKEAVKEVFAGLRRLGDDMAEVAKKIRAAQLRHAGTLESLGRAEPLLRSDVRIAAAVEAALDIVSSMADAQIITMEVGQQQLRLSMDQMEKMVDLNP